MFRSDTEALRARVEAQEVQIAQLQVQLALKATDLHKKSREMSEQTKERLKNTFKRTFFFGLGMGTIIAVVTGVIFAVGALIDGCSNPLHAGIIESRLHHEAYTTHGEICTGSGSSRHCTPTTTYHPERWTIFVAHEGRDEEFALDHDEWLETRIGQWFCVQEPCPPVPSGDDYEESPQ